MTHRSARSAVLSQPLSHRGALFGALAVPALAWLYVLVNSHRWSADERPGDRPDEPRDERAGA